MINALLSHLISTDDFHDLSHSVILRNNTSGILIAENKSVSILEFKPDGIILKCPENCCVVTHALSLFIMEDKLFKKLKRVPDDGKIRGSVELLGRVVEIEKKKGFWVLDINFTQYDVKEWKKFYEVYLKHQEKITELADMDLRAEIHSGGKKDAV